MNPPVVTYIAVSHGPITADYCARFVGTWLEYPPGVDCRLIVACNGGPLPMETGLLFLPLNAEFLPRTNDPGWDISAYQQVAQQPDVGFLVCLGESVHFWREGWLLRLALAREKFGPGMYGCYSSFLVRPHMNTTAFAVDAQYLRTYPKVTDKRQRYEFEHGQRAFWKHVQARGGATKFVTWDGVYDPPHWRSAQNILWKGDQSALLLRCNHTQRFEEAPLDTKRKWQQAADSRRVMA